MGTTSRQQRRGCAPPASSKAAVAVRMPHVGLVFDVERDGRHARGKNTAIPSIKYSPRLPANDRSSLREIGALNMRGRPPVRLIAYRGRIQSLAAGGRSLHPYPRTIANSLTAGQTAEHALRPKRNASRRGRRRLESTTIHATLPAQQFARLQAWRAAQPKPMPTIPEAVRTLLDISLGKQKA